MNDDKEFTFAQLNNWRAYEKVRLGGRWNMFDPSARRATGLTPEEYSFTIANYSALREAVAKEDAS
ncbi:MAG: hypothetical protein WC100_02540 [Sterolibacterium sp.]